MRLQQTAILRYSTRIQCVSLLILLLLRRYLQTTKGRVFFFLSTKWLSHFSYAGWRSSGVTIILFCHCVVCILCSGGSCVGFTVTFPFAATPFREQFPIYSSTYMHHHPPPSRVPRDIHQLFPNIHVWLYVFAKETRLSKLSQITLCCVLFTIYLGSTSRGAPQMKYLHMYIYAVDQQSEVRVWSGRNNMLWCFLEYY